MNQAVVEVCDRALYDLARERAPAANGPLDPLMGISGKVGSCQTCGEPMQKCNGHFGYVKLALPALHIGYLKKIITVLQNICKVQAVAKLRIARLMGIRDALERFSQRRTAGITFGTCGGQTSIICARLKFVRRSMSIAERLDPVITAMRSMDGSRRLEHLP